MVDLLLVSVACYLCQSFGDVAPKLWERRSHTLYFDFLYFNYFPFIECFEGRSWVLIAPDPGFYLLVPF